MEQKLIIKGINARIKEGLPAGFSGMGVILIEDNTVTLPITPLLSAKCDLSSFRNEKEIVDFILGISNSSDKRHDGFHVISLKKGLLSISQYFSPPIPKFDKNTICDVGARYRTAQYGSLCKGILSIIVVAQTGLISIAKNGIMETLE